MKKELKKLSLHKEELVNLNAPEMDSIKGGTSSGVCGEISKEVLSGLLSNAVYELSKEVIGSIADYITGSDGSDGSEGSDGSDDMGDISKYQDPYYGGCLLPEVEVTP